MSLFKEMGKNELRDIKTQTQKKLDEWKGKGLKLDMSRGKPGTDQLEISNPLLGDNNGGAGFKSASGFDLRNYGVPEGIFEMRKLFADLLNVETEHVLLSGNSSLNIMFDTVAQGLIHGFGSGGWLKQGNIKFLCPAPGYDRHFSICEYFGIEMIPVEMTPSGPDMDAVETLVSGDPMIKGLWCVPMYSNPTGLTFSDDTVRRFARLQPAAKDFRIFWDNSYFVHHVSSTPDTLLNILDEAKKAGNEDIAFVFASTSKITFPGGGVSAVAASPSNLKAIKARIVMQTIGPDKLNQLRHAAFLKDVNGVAAHMEKHAKLLRPKFHAVLTALSANLAGKGIAEWTTPRGGYFISFNTLEGCAKRVVALCAEAGVTLTPAGATYPYGKDQKDSNIRIAPTFPPINELQDAMEIFCLAVILASAEKLLNEQEY